MKKFVRIIAVCLNLLIVIAFLLTTIAGWVAPSRSVWPSLMAFGYLPLLAANVLFSLIWMFCRRWEFLISAVAIALRWAMIPVYIQVGGKSQMPPPADDVVTILTFNTHQFRGVDDQASPSADKAREFLSMVEQNGPDIICLQEYGAVKGVAVTDSLRYMGYTEHYSARTSRAGEPYGTVLFSRLPIDYVRQIDRQSKFYADIDNHGHTVRVVCIHMESYGLDNSDREEIDRMAHGDLDSTATQTIAKLTHTITKHEKEWQDELRPIVEAASVPLIMVGDMNDIPSSYLYHQVSDQLRDSFTQCGSWFGTTYCGKDLPAFRIDYVFHSSQLRCIAHRRLRSSVSDHHAVIAALQIIPNDQ
ncbi:MAG: endonuclease/exonuclease/phosphatase family protein [Bacteroidales bacterium]|nr:endonuclease/exonuclease/phosphatase family protein [Bacteroidales bacterium]